MELNARFNFEQPFLVKSKDTLHVLREIDDNGLTGTLETVYDKTGWSSEQDRFFVNGQAGITNSFTLFERFILGVGLSMTYGQTTIHDDGAFLTSEEKLKFEFILPFSLGYVF